MTTENVPRVWFNPPKFWAATKRMSREEADQFFTAISRMAEERDFDGLRRFDFIQVGPTYPHRADC